MIKLKVYLKPYLKNNLGDDIFVHIVSNRYDEKFYMCNRNEYGEIFKKNINVYSGKIYRIINKIIRTISSGKSNFQKFLSNKCDLSILIGGSMFMELEDKKFKYELSKPYYVLGSNFGPYKTQGFYDEFYDFFKNAEDVCFREKYSKDLFKDLDNTRYASDIVFTLDTSDVVIKDSKKAIISVIDCDRKINPNYTKLYEENIINLINLLCDKGYGVTLMSFCKAEGDEKAIESIYSKLGNNIVENVDKYYYNGNIKEALDIMGDSSVIFGTRFHANILGLLLEKTVIPIAYSDKTLNVFNDMNFNGKIFDIRDKEFDLCNLSSEDLQFKFDVKKQIEDANRQFEKLDKILKRKEKNG